MILWYYCALIIDIQAIELDPCTSSSFQSKLLKPIDLDERIIELIKVDADSALKDFVKQKHWTFKRCCFFYEFTDSVECITEDQKLIFLQKVHKFVFHMELHLFPP